MWEEELCVQTDPLHYVTSASFCMSRGNFQCRQAVTAALVTASTAVSCSPPGQVTVAQLETLWQKFEQFAFQ